MDTIKIGDYDVSKSDFKKWISALRSGEYIQIRGTMQNTNGYCCLGVACKVLINEPTLVDNNKYLYGDKPIYQHNSPEWLTEIDIIVEDIHGTSLTAMNDVYGSSFKEIANFLEITFLNKGK
jgi:hypothetical protein